ncbi:MAG: phasin family protein [Xanthobacteraceae bacterium]|nr:MAG: phasin family protein [Xanthobacteraceae bacterium]
MVKVEEFQQFGKEQIEAATQSAAVFSKGTQAIALAVTDYAKKSFEDTSKLFEKLAATKSFDKAVEVQTEFAKSSYETFVAEATKLGELYADLAKEAYKPFEGYFSKLNIPSARS